MKKKTTSSPLKTFNDNKAKAYMKAGGAMKAFKKSLPKAQLGETFINRKEALDALRNAEARGSRDNMLRYLNNYSPEGVTARNKAFYDSLTPVEEGYVRAPFRPGNDEENKLRLQYEGTKRSLAQRDAAETYLRNSDKVNPIGTLKTKPAMPIQKKGGVVKKKKK